MKRPETRFQEMEEIQKRSNLTDAAAYYVATRRNIKLNGITFEDAIIIAASHEYEKVETVDLSQ